MPRGQTDITYACECGTTLMWSGLLDSDRSAIDHFIEWHVQQGHQQVEPQDARRIRQSERDRTLGRRSNRYPKRRPIPDLVVRSPNGHRSHGSGAWHAVALGGLRSGLRTLCGRSISQDPPEAKGRSQRGWERQVGNLPQVEGACQICLKKGDWGFDWG